MTGDDLGQALYLVALLAFLVAMAARRRDRGGAPPAEPAPPSAGETAPGSNAYFAFLWLLIVVALVLAAYLYRKGAL